MGKDSMKPRDPQTRVKHTILKNYAGHWGGIILQGLKETADKESSRGKPFTPQFIYVDYHAYYGRYLGEREDWEAGRDPSQTVFGSPVIGVQALDSLVEHAWTKYRIDLRVNAILIERDPRKFAELKKSLEMAGFGHRVVETFDFSTLKRGQIAIWCGDSTQLTSRILAYTQRAPFTYSLHMIDPYGASGVPFRRLVAPIIRAPHHDVILYMPYLDLHRKSGFITKPDLNDDQSNRVLHFDEMFDDDGKWQNLVVDLDTDVIWSQAMLDPDWVDTPPTDPKRVALAKYREQDLIRHYKSQLETADKDLIVKSIRLPFPDRDQTMYYLYLTTHDPTGALMMNEVIAKAGLLSEELRQRLRDIMKKRPSQLRLFEIPETDAPHIERPSTQDIATDIARLVEVRTMKRRDIYRALANELYFPSEVDKAIEWLSKQKKVSFDSQLRNSTFIRSNRDHTREA